MCLGKLELIIDNVASTSGFLYFVLYSPQFDHSVICRQEI